MTTKQQQIPLDMTLLTMLKGTPGMWLALVVMGACFVQSGFSTTSLGVFFGALILWLCVALTTIYSFKGSWIRFDGQRITYFKSGRQYDLNLRELKSIRCPKSSQRYFLDFIHLRFNTGPCIRLSAQNSGFPHAKTELLHLLHQDASLLKSCRVVGDLE